MAICAWFRGVRAAPGEAQARCTVRTDARAPALVRDFVVAASGKDVVPQALGCQLPDSPLSSATPAGTGDPPGIDDKPESSIGSQSLDRACAPPSPMIAFYSETRDHGNRIERLLTNADVETTESRRAFRRMVQHASVGITSLKRCDDQDLEWLHAAFDHGHSGPSCVVVTPLSLARLQRLRRIESTRFHVVWFEEVEDRLVQLLDEIEPWHRDPLRLLGHRLLRDFSLHWSLVKAIDHICSVTANPPRTPPIHSVIELAERIRLPPDTLRRYWREEVPLRSGPKKLQSWALLMWAIRQRSDLKWDTIAQRAGVRRRTLERSSTRLLGCTLAEASRDPERVQQSFREWVAKVSSGE